MVEVAGFKFSAILNEPLVSWPVPSSFLFQAWWQEHLDRSPISLTLDVNKLVDGFPILHQDF